MVSWLLAVLLAGALYWLVAQCSACARFEADAVLTLAPLGLLLIATAVLAALPSVAVHAYVARALATAGSHALLEPVGDEDVPFAAAGPRARPLTALIAAVLLFAMLAWAIVLELHAFAAPERPAAQTTQTAQAVEAPAGDALVTGLFLAVDSLLAVLVVICAVIVVRRIVANARSRAGRADAGDG